MNASLSKLKSSQEIEKSETNWQLGLYKKLEERTRIDIEIGWVFWAHYNFLFALTFFDLYFLLQYFLFSYFVMWAYILRFSRFSCAFYLFFVCSNCLLHAMGFAFPFKIEARWALSALSFFSFALLKYSFILAYSETMC